MVKLFSMLSGTTKILTNVYNRLFFPTLAPISDYPEMLIFVY